MSMIKTNSVLAGAIAMAFAGGSALAAGAMPYDGDGSGAGFTIDHASFDPTNVEAAPCPTGAVCANGTATDGSGMLMREVSVNGERYYQQIVADLGGLDGDFVMEAAVTTSGEANNYASKVRIAQGTGAAAFFTEQTFQRGAHFNGVAAGNNFGNTYFNVDQSVGGFQDFNMNSTGNPGGNQANAGISNGTVTIAQLGGIRAGNFLHVVKHGTAVPIGGTLEIDGVGAIAYAAGARISATAIGYTMYNGGPEDTILADGQLQDHNHRTADQVDFGLLIYREGGQTGNGGSGGLAPDGTTGAQFSQGLATQEIRAFSLHPDQASGEFYNINHGSFEGGAALITDNWAPIFGTVPF